MPYQLMFCLASQDDGTTTNPNLHPVLDDHDQPMEYISVADVYKAQRLMSRGAHGLRFYAVEMSPDDKVPHRKPGQP